MTLKPTPSNDIMMSPLWIHIEFVNDNNGCESIKSVYSQKHRFINKKSKTNEKAEKDSKQIKLNKDSN